MSPTRRVFLLLILPFYSSNHRSADSISYVIDLAFYNFNYRLAVSIFFFFFSILIPSLFHKLIPPGEKKRKKKRPDLTRHYHLTRGFTPDTLT